MTRKWTIGDRKEHVKSVCSVFPLHFSFFTCQTRVLYRDVLHLKNISLFVKVNSEHRVDNINSKALASEWKVGSGE